MRSILSIILVLFILPIQATTYYVSASGSDTAGGTTPETAWQTLRKVSLVSYVEGDQVVLKKRGYLLRHTDHWQLRHTGPSNHGGGLR